MRIEYLDSLHGVLPILVSAGSTFVHWSADFAKPKNYIQFADATLSLRIELPLFYWGKSGDLSTFVESFIGDTPIGRRTTDMIAKDELWIAGDVVSLKQQDQ